MHIYDYGTLHKIVIVSSKKVKHTVDSQANRPDEGPQFVQTSSQSAVTRESSTFIQKNSDLRLRHFRTDEYCRSCDPFVVMATCGNKWTSVIPKRNNKFVLY